jgi:hypothetical protein
MSPSAPARRSPDTVVDVDRYPTPERKETRTDAAPRAPSGECNHKGMGPPLYTTGGWGLSGGLGSPDTGLVLTNRNTGFFSTV